MIKDYFEFLKPSRGKLISTGALVVFFITFLLWNYLVPMTGNAGGDIPFFKVGANLSSEGRMLTDIFCVVLILAFTLITYVLISLISYFTPRRHKR